MDTVGEVVGDGVSACVQVGEQGGFVRLTVKEPLPATMTPTEARRLAATLDAAANLAETRKNAAAIVEKVTDADGPVTKTAAEGTVGMIPTVQK